MAYSKARRLSDLISATGEVASYADASIVPADLHATLDLTGKTITVANTSTGDSDTTVANTAFVQQEIAALVASAPGTLNTLNELAAALGDDASFSTTVTDSIATKLPLAGGTMTGNLVVNAIVDADNFKINNAQGTDGQLLTSTGSGVAWEDAPAGGVAGIVTSANATAITIDSAETIFHKTTSPTLHSAVTGIVFENGSLLNDVTRGDGKSITLAQNLAVDSGNTWAYLAAGEGSYYQQFNGNHYFGTAASGSAGADATVNTKMLINSAGNVGIGTGSPSAPLDIVTDSVVYAAEFTQSKTSNGDGVLINIGSAAAADYALTVRSNAGNTSVLACKGDGKVGIGTFVPAVSLDVGSTTDAIKLPNGTTAQRPTGALGQIRYNTTTSEYEVYKAGLWLSVKTTAGLRFLQGSTYFNNWTISADGQTALPGNTYAVITANLNFEGNFVILSKWSQDYMSAGICYKAGITNADFTGESADGNGPYGGGTSVDGFASGVSGMYQYHFPNSTVGGGNYPLIYIRHKRTGNTISTAYSTNSSAATDPSHSSWTGVDSQSVASTDHCKPYWGQASGTYRSSVEILYVDVTGAFNST
jgi:hypothetical protein